MNILCYLLLAFAQANESYTADVFDIDGKEKLFTYAAERTYTADTMKFTSTFKDLTGAVVATEKAELKNGKIIKYEVERIPTKESGLIEGKDGKMVFTYTESGKKSSATTTPKSDVLISANLVPYIEAHLKELLAKKDVTFGYAVWFRKEIMSFKFSYEKEEGENVVIKMNPTNMLYRSLVNPIYFTLNKTTKKLVSVKGRSLPKIKQGSAYRDFDGFVKYN